MGLRATAKKMVWAAVPLGARKRLAIWVDRQEWIPNRHTWTLAMIRDLAEKDLHAYHRFLWTNHVGYAKFYEKMNEFGAEKILLPRRLLFADLLAHLEKSGVDARREVRSVFDVGCAMGHLLRYMETEMFPGATELVGVDIDDELLEDGRKQLGAMASKIRLEHADATELGPVMGERKFDVILCAGVLLYLDEAAATEAIGTMLGHGGLVVLAGLPHTKMDNREMQRSEPRGWDAGQIHNLDAMVEKCGGRVVYRRYDVTQDYDGQKLYFVFGERGGREQ